MDQQIPSNPNLLDERRENGRVGANGFWFTLTLSVLSVLAALAFGYECSRYVRGAATLLALCGTFSFFALCAVLVTLIETSVERRLIVVFLDVLGFLAFFYAQPLNLLAVAGLLTTFFLAWGDYSTRHELESGVEIKFFRAVGPQVNKIITAGILLGLVFYLPASMGQAALVPEATFQTLFSWITQAMSFLRIDLRLNSTAEEFATGIAADELQNNPVYRGLAPAAQAKALADGARQIITSMSWSLGVNAQPSDTMRDILYRYVSSLLMQWREKFGTPFFVAWIAVIFLLVRSVGFFLGLAVTFVLYVVFNLLVAADLIKIEHRSRMQEVITT